jgi:thioredoxin 1
MCVTKVTEKKFMPLYLCPVNLYMIRLLKETKNKLKIDSMLEHLTIDTFKTKVFNFETNKEWKYEGDTPCLIDFYADWCGPCKMIAPILEQLQGEYKDKLNIYKVNTEEERELASMFGIQSIPSLLFVPKDGKPQMAMGALPKETFEQAFKEVLGVSKI